ncbi:uncharacterized protein LOC144570693 [Carex rostrata]
MVNSRGNSNGFVSPSLVIKIILVVVSAVSLYFLAKLSVPYISSLLSVAVPQIWAVISAWLAPPYLFITVHFIILVIWKLSDHKPSRDHLIAPHQAHPVPVVKPKQQQLPREISSEIPREIPTRAEEWAPSIGEPALPKHNLSAEILPVTISREEPRYFQWAPREEQTLPMQSLSREISPKNSHDKSCLTEEKSEEKSTASSHIEMRRSERPQLAQKREVVRRQKPERKVPSPSPVVVEEGEVDVDDSMDATWKAIMQTPRPVVPTTDRAEESTETSVGADEMNRRFEDFIKKSRDRLQVEEPTRHGHGARLAMAK